MAGNITNRLAELAGLVSEPAELPRFSPRDSETEAEWNARLVRRAERVTRWALKWDKDDIAERYAWMLLLALELRASAKQDREMIDGLFVALKRDRAAIDALRRMDNEYQERLVDRLARYQVDRKRGAATKLARDPKQAAKAKALELWKERQAGKHPELRTVEQFAAEVMLRWPVLQSSKVICGWSTEWTRAVKEGRTPAC